METGGRGLMNLWHTLDIPELFDRLNASDKGLEPEEVTSRQQQYGPNEIKGKAGVTAFELLAGQFKNFLILLLLFAALISIGIAIWEHSVQEMIEGGLIALIVVFIVGVGFYQEYHAETWFLATSSTWKRAIGCRLTAECWRPFAFRSMKAS
jgi:Ca2+-transporting ATPase